MPNCGKRKHSKHNSDEREARKDREAALGTGDKPHERLPLPKTVGGTAIQIGPGGSDLRMWMVSAGRRPQAGPGQGPRGYV